MRPNTIKTERRRQRRDEVDAHLGILCTDAEGQGTQLQARLVDISLNGAKMRVSQRLAKNTTVYFYCHKFGIGGRGSVRYCEQRKQGYEIGLEFPSGTGWKELRATESLALAAEVSGAAAGGIIPAPVLS
jgi:hypothetical protein